LFTKGEEILKLGKHNRLPPGWIMSGPKFTALLTPPPITMLPPLSTLTVPQLPDIQPNEPQFELPLYVPKMLISTAAAPLANPWQSELLVSVAPASMTRSSIPIEPTMLVSVTVCGARMVMLVLFE